MNPKNNSFIINNQNFSKDLSILEKLKRIRLKLSNYKCDNNKKLNKTYISSTIKNNNNTKNYMLIKSIKISKNPSNTNNNNKKQLNNRSYNYKNHNDISINKNIEKKKYNKLKNKTPDISSIASTKFKKNIIIGYNCLNKNKINNNNSNSNEIYKDCKNKKYNKIKITYENNNKNKNKKAETNKNNNNNNYIEWKKLNLNTFNNYLKNLKEKNNYIHKKINHISKTKNTSKNKDNSVTPLNNSINNNKQQNNSLNTINYSTINSSILKNNKNVSYKENKSSIVRKKNNNKIKKKPNISFYLTNKDKGNKKYLRKNFPTSVNSSIILDDKFNIKVKYNTNKDKYINKENNLNKKIKQILSKSQQEIEKIKNDFVIHFTTKTSPRKNELKNTINNKSFMKKSNNNKNNKSIQINKNTLIKKMNDKKIFNLTKKKYKIFDKNKYKNNENNKENIEKIEKIKELKNNLLNNDSKTTINNNNDKINENINDNIQNQNNYLNESIQLSNYIKKYYKEHKEYPKTNLNFYKYGRIIGQGSFGKVNIGLNVLTGRIVAIKSFDKNKLGSKSQNMKKILYESNLMKKLNHPNITKILEMFEDEKFFLIIMEYINGGNLFSFVKKRRKLSEKTAKFLFRQIILGIQHMHSKNIVHRDIKLENILIDLNNNIKICDFGISLILNSLSDILFDHCGTPMYIAPEILLSNENKGYLGPPVDIWSAGIALYIMLSGNLPFNITDISYDIDNDIKCNDLKNNISLQYNILNKHPKNIENISDLAQDLLNGILNKNPQKRLTVDEVLNHPWLYLDDNYKYHLFTKTEMIMLSKTFIDYRYNKSEDLLESFTISNLKCDNQNKDKNDKSIDQNIITKSSILTPYNSMINDDIILYNEIHNNNNITISDDEKNNEIQFENNFIIFSNKTKELNMIYELNNNEEIDNGILINSRTNTSRSNKLNISQEINYNDNNYIIKNKNNLHNKLNEKEKINYILDKIEIFGYNKEYAAKIIDNNELSHIYAVYFLLSNYDRI